VTTPRIPIDICTASPPQPLPPCKYRFPDASRGPRDQPVAMGGDFEPETVVAAYRHGIFPWPNDYEELCWFSPDPRAILPVGGLHVSRRLERVIRQGRFRVTLDAEFERVIEACAARDATWITPRLIDGYVRLHQLGWAHSFEVWMAGDVLAGGLYGVGVGTMFGAESMFHTVSDASKIAMAAMMQHAEDAGWTLVDIQVLTEHTQSMGALEIPRADYLRRLAAAVGPFAP
jgi:leucyl/phenylalanyl-tRNA--protein transferase